MSVSATNSSIRRVLSISDDTSFHDFLEQALCVSHDKTTSQNGSTELLNPTSANVGAYSFKLVSVEAWQTALQNVG